MNRPKIIPAALVATFVAAATSWAGFQPPAFIDCTVPDPVSRTTGNATRVCQPVWEGCAYYVRTGIVCDRLLVRFTASTGAPSVGVNFYQGDASGYPLKKIGTFSFSPVAAPANYEAAPSEGVMGVHQGPVFVLFGLTSLTGSATLRTYTVAGNDLLNTNLDVNYWPSSWVTTLSTTSAPLTFDPRTSPTGIAVPSLLDVCPTIRLRKT